MKSIPSPSRHFVAFRGNPIPYVLETDWPVGAAGFELPHQEACPITYRYRATQRVAADPVPKSQQLGHGLPTALKPAGCKFPDAEVRILPPQPASPSITPRL